MISTVGAILLYFGFIESKIPPFLTFSASLYAVAFETPVKRIVSIKSVSGCLEKPSA